MQLKIKIERSSKELAKLKFAWRSAEQDADQEMITQEERENFRKMGLKMDSSFVLGKQEPFLVWKYLFFSMVVNNLASRYSK